MRFIFDSSSHDVLLTLGAEGSNDTCCTERRRNCGR
jgi:hypothetical protein